MDKKPLIVVSILAVVLLVLGSLSNVVASDDNNKNNNFKNYQSEDGPYDRYIGLISKVNKTENGYISFYAIYVFWVGADYFEGYLVPGMGLYVREKLTIRDDYKGILTNHFIFIKQDG